MRSMKISAPSAKPTTMPSVRSRKITSRKVTSEHCRVARMTSGSSAAMAVFSTMFQATTASTPARAASGM
jgi:hypothetical protein